MTVARTSPPSWRCGAAGTGRGPGTARCQARTERDTAIECDTAPRHLTIVERRALWRTDFGPEWTTFPIARLRYTATHRLWTLYWRDHNLRFHHYDPMAPSTQIDDLLAEIDRDPTAIFWG